MQHERYRGRGMDLSDLPPVVQEACLASMRRTVTFYGEDTVDAQMTHDQVRLCEATAEYLYSEHTPLQIACERGSRPELERFAEEAVAGAEGERDRAIAVMRFVRDLHTRRPGAGSKGAADPFHGGTEEEVIKKGSNMCNEQARTFCALCEAAGIPARYIGHYVGGHGVMEAYVDGAWTYFDNRGKYFVKPDGALASTWDIIRDPDIIDRQPPEVTAEMREGYDYDSTRRYFAPVEVTVVTNYGAADFRRFGYGWIWNTHELQARVAEVRREFPDALSAENVLAMIRGEKRWPH